MPKKPSPSARAASHRILIVESQRELSRLIRPHLEELTNSVELLDIPSGEEAVLDASHLSIDLLVAEYLLPGMTGIELMSKVRLQQPGIRVILVCGPDNPDICDQVTAAGADACFLKPVPPVEFLAAVDRLLVLQKPLPVKPPTRLLTREKPAPVKPVWQEPPSPIISLPELLADCRRDLKARAVLLINKTGQVLARAGDLPDMETETTLLTSIISIYTAGRKISSILKEDGLSNWCVFDGGRYDLIFVPLDEEYALLSIGEDLAREKNILRKVTLLRQSRSPVLAAITGKDQSSAELRSPSVSGLAPADENSKDPGLEPLLTEMENKPQTPDLDAFWEHAASEQSSPLKPDMLSYEQAKQLGLAPEDGA